MENQNQIQNKNGEISIGDIIRVLVRGWLPGLISSVALILVLLIGIIAVINPRKTQYNVKFQYQNIPGLDDGQYIDGTKFNYRDLVAKETVSYIISTNKDFESINQNSLLNNNKFSIEQTFSYRDASNKDYTIISTDYLISMPSKAFKDSKQAKSFATALVEYPITKTIEKLNNLEYQSNIKAYNDSVTFTNKLNYLSSQINLMTSGYDSWIETETDSYVVINGEQVKLSALRNTITNYLTEKNYYSMSTELQLNGYVYSESEKYGLEVDLAKLKNDLQYLGGYTVDSASYYPSVLTATSGEREDLVNQLDALTSSTNTAANTQIIASEAYTILTNKIAEVDQKILNNKKSQDIINRKLASINNTDKSDLNNYKNRLDEIFNKVKDFTDIYTEVSKTLYNRNMIVFYSNSNVISSTGSISLVKTLGISVVAGIITFLAVAGIYGYVKLKKEEK